MISRANRSQALPLLLYFVGARGEPGNEANDGGGMLGHCRMLGSMFES